VDGELLTAILDFVATLDLTGAVQGEDMVSLLAQASTPTTPSLSSVGHIRDPTAAKGLADCPLLLSFPVMITRVSEAAKTSYVTGAGVRGGR
jgi:hypothetical protein